nr:hypothetical protein [Tanacetum cinerariifolium]
MQYWDKCIINFKEINEYSAATCIFGGVIATLTKQVANLELDKVAQAIEITKLKQRSGGGCIQTRRKIAELDADEDVTLEEVDAEVTKDADVQGRLKESKAKVYHLHLYHADKVLSMQETNEAEPTEHYNSIQAFLEKGEKEIEEEGSKSSTQRAAKKRKIDEETKELKKHLQEDLEMLWKLAQERFQSSEPKNFSDDFLQNTLK